MGAGRRWWIAVLTFSALLTQLTVNMVRPATTYKVDAMGGDATLVGVVAGTYAVIPLICAMSVGRLIQRLPVLTGLMAAGLLVMALGAAAVALSPAVSGLIGGTALLGFGQLVFTIAGQSAVSRASAEDTVDSNFGWFTAGVSAGQMLGPLLAGVIIDMGPHSDAGTGIDPAIWAGAVAVAPGVAVLGLLALRSSQTSATKRTAHGTGSEDSITARHLLRRPRVGSYIISSAGLLALTDILVAFVPLIGHEAGLSPTAVGVLLAVRGVGSLVSRLLLGILAARYHRSTLLTCCLLVSAVCFAVLPLTVAKLWTAAMLMLVGGFFLGLGQPLTMSMITRTVPEEWRSPALALRLVGNRLGQVLIPLTAGAVAGSVGASGAIWLGTLLLMLSGLEESSRGSTGPTDITDPREPRP